MKRSILPILSFSLLVFIVTFIYRYAPPLELYPKNETYLEYGAGFLDSLRNGSFEDRYLDTSHDHLHFTLSKKPASASPSLLFHSHELVRTVDISRYKYIEVEVEPEHTDDFSLSIFMYIPNFSNPARTDTHRPYTMNFRIRNNQSLYRYPIDAFATPAKWFGYTNTSMEDLPETDWTKMTHIMFEPLYSQSEEKEFHQISLNRLQLVNSLREELLFSLAISLLFAGISFLILFVKKTHATAPKKNSEPVYRTVQRGYSREQKKELIDFIGSQYGNPLMSLDFIQKRTSLNSYQVNEILKDCCNMLYKEYINSIRIKEAKRLLAETNKQIGEIAENVGYCYSNSFARIFRKTEHMTPNQYRKNFRKNQ